jgi:hypothetical protein
LKNPLYGLLIADDPQMRLNLITGVKRISIREGHRDYRLGDVLIGDSENTFVVTATFSDIKHVLLSEVTREEWEADGFTSQEDMLAKMKEFYPKITLDSEVTVLFWKNVRGYWTTQEGIEYFREVFFN